MQPATPALKALLATRQFYRSDLYIFTLADGSPLRWSGGDCDIVSEGVLYPCGGAVGPYFGRQGNAAQCHQKLGTDVDSLTVHALPGRATVKGAPFLSAVQNGVFDGAWMELRRAYAPALANVAHWPIPATGSVRRFLGRVAEADAGGLVATFTINSPMELLQRQLPRNLYQPGCLNVVGDDACGVDLDAYGVGGAAGAGSDALRIYASLPQTSGWFDLGTVAFTSGGLAGQARSVRSWVAPNTITLMTPFPMPPAAGDTFVITPGCDGSLGVHGCPKFDNLANFRGFPFVPPPSTAT
jgi:uncharacterized phage protein (TIGR02218 family)